MNQIQSEISAGVLVITINRPEAKNALSLEMYSELTGLLEELDSNEQLACALIKGHESCFSSGNDLKDFLSSGELNSQHPTTQFLHKINTTQKPIVAAVSGLAIGIGTTMLLHCDMVFAAENASFQLPFCQLGLCPELASSELLPKLAGYQKAFELLVLGERFDVTTAKEIGLINQVVGFEQLDDVALKATNKIAKLPSQAVIKTKALLQQGLKQNTKQMIDNELTQFKALLNTKECQNIISGFFKK